MNEENIYTVDIDSFKELYTKNRNNNTLCNDIKIVKSVNFPGYIKQDEKFYEKIKKDQLLYLVTQILDITSEFPDDVLHIKCKIFEEYDATKYPDAEIELIIAIYILSGLRYK